MNAAQHEVAHPGMGGNQGMEVLTAVVNLDEGGGGDAGDKPLTSRYRWAAEHLIL